MDRQKVNKNIVKKVKRRAYSYFVVAQLEKSQIRQMVYVFNLTDLIRTQKQLLQIQQVVQTLDFRDSIERQV